MKLLLLATVLVALCGCSEKKRQTEQETTANVTEMQTPPFQIIEEVANKTLNRCDLEIMLKERITENELHAIAEKLRSTRAEYNRLWIFYHLEGSDPEARAWAATHYAPELKVMIFGTTAEQQAAIEKTTVTDGILIGQWFEDSGEKCAILKKGNRYIIRNFIKEGGSFDMNLVKREKQRFDNEEGGHGEYYIIEASGDLGMYNKKDERFALAKKAPENP